MLKRIQNHIELKPALVSFAVFVAYIIFSDHLLYSLFSDGPLAERISVLKGVLFVASVSYWIGRALKTERRLIAQREEEYRKLFVSSPVPIVIYDIETRKVLDVNLEVLKLLEYQREDLVGTILPQLKPTLSDQEFVSHLDRVKNEKDQAYRGIWRLKTKNGRDFPVSITSFHCHFQNKQARLIYIEDLSDLFIAEQELSQARLNLARLSAQVPVGLYRLRVSKEGKITILFLNQRISTIMGLGPNADQAECEKYFQSFLQYISHNGKNGLKLYKSEQGQSVQWTGSWENAKKDLRWLKAQGLCDQDGEDQIWNGILEDHTEARLLEEMSLLNSKLITLGEVSGHIAHEIKTPLSIAQLATIQLTQELETTSSPSIDYAKKAEEALSRVAKTILGLERLSRNEFHEGKYLTPIKDIIADAESLTKARVLAANACLTIAPIPDIAIEVHSVQITQILINLINNASDALEELPEQNNSRDIQLRVSHDDQHVFFDLDNNGPPITEEIKRSLFRPFFSTKPSGRGTGLGLSISQKLARAHRGELTLEKGPRTCFRLSLPLAMNKPPLV
jgi:PAS domain S-box-containing protein